MTFPLGHTLCWGMRTKRRAANIPGKPSDLGALIIVALDLAISEEKWEVAEHLMKAIESLEGTRNAEHYLAAAYRRLIRDAGMDSNA